MQRLLAASLFVTALGLGRPALAVMPDESGVAQTLDLRPPTAARRSARSLFATAAHGDGTVTYLGSGVLPEASGASEAADASPNVIAYLQQVTGDADLELLVVGKSAEDDGEERYAFVQSVHGVPILGTYALAQLQGGLLHYARQYLVPTPQLDMTVQLDASRALGIALADGKTFAGNVTASAEAPSLAVLYSDATASLVWQTPISTEAPFGSWQIYVDAKSGAVRGRHKTSLDAVSGTVSGHIEPSCQGDAPVQVSLPFVQWAPGMVTARDGNFTTPLTVQRSQVRVVGPYFKIISYDNADYTFGAALNPAPAFNEVALPQAPLSQLDPFYYASQVRYWVRQRLYGMASGTRSRAWAWTDGQMPIKVNLPNGFQGFTCNAFYDKTALNFYVASPGMCNNSGRAAKIVYHEYGHGVHDHLTAAPNTFDPQVSEGAADYIAATYTNSPNITGLLNCSKPMPGYSTIRTCENHYAYCDNDRAGCSSYPISYAMGKRRGLRGAEPHNAAPIMCGALWDMRTQMQKRYGSDAGIVKADQFVLRFLRLATDMNSAYTAAIAADDDDDGDPRNGTVHSCEINRAFLGAGGGANHFPDLAYQMVPCRS